MKRCHSLLLGLFLAVAAVNPSSAFDCGSSNDIVDRSICMDEHLRSANADLERAYEAVLRLAPDEEIRAMLTESQRRWRAALVRALQRTPERSGVATSSLYPTNRREVLETALKTRLAALSDRRNNGVPELIQRALENREHALTRYYQGDFSGYDTSCEFMPIDYSYLCLATRNYRNGKRICTVKEYWTSAGPNQDRYVADVSKGKPKLIASCSLNSRDPTCPIGVRDDARWNTKPAAEPGLYRSRQLPKLDVEVLEEDVPWIKTCLTDPSFPLADPTQSVE